MAVRFKLFQRDRSMVLVTEGLGPQQFHGRTVVLINEHSHSAAEMVASFAKENHLATLGGTRTAGESPTGATFTMPRGNGPPPPAPGLITPQADCPGGQGA